MAAAAVNRMSNKDKNVGDSSSVDDEEAYLLGRTPLSSRAAAKRCFPVRYRRNWVVKNRYSWLILFMVLLVHSFDPTVIASEDMFNTGKQVPEQVFVLDVYSGCSVLFYVFYPITGLYADLRFGRYKTGLTSLVLTLVCNLVMVVGIFVYQILGYSKYNQTNEQAGGVILLLGYVFGKFSRTAFVIVMVSFGVDQLPGASSEGLSAYVQWFYLSYITGWGLSVPIICFLQRFAKNNLDIFLLFGAHILFLLVCILIMIYYRKHLITEPQLKSNPVAMIFKVLRYAKNHRYPTNRSALTYWENNYPSRIDLGKQKYGRPFTEEQVQDVKTLLKMVPLVVCMLTFYISADGYDFFTQPSTNSNYVYCLLTSVYFLNSFTIIVVVMLNLTILNPLLHKWYPSMLKRIGLGIFICVIAQGLMWVIEAVGQADSQTKVCILSNNTQANSYFLYPVTVVPKLVNGIGFGVVAPTTLEFAFAQAPYSMRGVIIGVWYMATGLFKTFSYCLLYPFKEVGTLWELPCEFYLLGTKFTLLGVSFVCFVCLSMCYKLRFRGDRFDQYEAVKNYYSSYLERSDTATKHLKPIIINEPGEEDSGSIH